METLRSKPYTKGNKNLLNMQILIIGKYIEEDLPPISEEHSEPSLANLAELRFQKKTGENTDQDAEGAKPSDWCVSLEKDADAAVKEHSAQVAQVGQSRLKLKFGSGRFKSGGLSLEKEAYGTVREHSAKVALAGQYRLNSRSGRARPSHGGLSSEIERN